VAGEVYPEYDSTVLRKLKPSVSVFTRISDLYTCTKEKKRSGQIASDQEHTMNKPRLTAGKFPPAAQELNKVMLHFYSIAY
jgi:hypothetical protein